jgi:predicted O-methyltransferase YrrM
MQPNVISRIGTAVWRRRHPQWAIPPVDRIAPQLELSARTLPRYAVDQLILAVDKRRHGVAGRPWITSTSMTMLDGLLRPTDHGLEFGSGGSTEWLAARLASLRSVEASDVWYRQVSARLAAHGVDNVDLELASDGNGGIGTPAHRGAYVNAHPGVEAGSLDLVFVDGEYRDSCAMRGISLLRPGGILVLDNANTHLPCRSRSPWHMSEPATAIWRQFLDEVADWRHVWTTNGSWDTALWFKP